MNQHDKNFKDICKISGDLWGSPWHKLPWGYCYWWCVFDCRKLFARYGSIVSQNQEHLRVWHIKINSSSCYFIWVFIQDKEYYIDIIWKKILNRIISWSFLDSLETLPSVARWSNTMTLFTEWLVDFDLTFSTMKEMLHKMKEIEICFTCICFITEIRK